MKIKPVDTILSCHRQIFIQRQFPLWFQESCTWHIHIQYSQAEWGPGMSYVSFSRRSKHLLNVPGDLSQVHLVPASAYAWLPPDALWPHSSELGTLGVWRHCGPLLLRRVGGGREWGWLHVSHSKCTTLRGNVLRF